MQAVLIARMQYTCNSCSDATACIDDIDVTQFQCHCMSYHISQKFIIPKKAYWLKFWANQNSCKWKSITERSYNIHLRVVFRKWLNERIQDIENVLQRVGKIWGVIVMLMTSLFWLLNFDDRFEMLLGESICWRLCSLFWWFSQCIKSIINFLNRLPISQACHQHIWSPISVTNIHITLSPGSSPCPNSCPKSSQCSR